MGFFKALGKMIQGKPVFEAAKKVANVTSSEQVEPAVDTPKMPDEHETVAPIDSPPRITLAHCRSHLNGQNMETTIWLTNESTVEIEVEKCFINDKNTHIGRRFNPGQSHEVSLYSGKVASTDRAHVAQFFYRSIRENAYYRVDYTVEYNRESDGTYTIEELHPEHYDVKELSRSSFL